LEYEDVKTKCVTVGFAEAFLLLRPILLHSKTHYVLFSLFITNFTTNGGVTVFGSIAVSLIFCPRHSGALTQRPPEFGGIAVSGIFCARFSGGIAFARIYGPRNSGAQHRSNNYHYENRTQSN